MKAEQQPKNGCGHELDEVSEYPQKQARPGGPKKKPWEVHQQQGHQAAALQLATGLEILISRAATLWLGVQSYSAQRPWV